jgi:hypothetical protein
MGRRDILTSDERRRLFDVPHDHDAKVKLYTLSRIDLDLVHLHRSEANRLGFAVQLALLRHPSLTPTEFEAPRHLVEFMAKQLGLRSAAINRYGARLQTVTGHSREVMAALNMRPANLGDFELMI